MKITMGAGISNKKLHILNTYAPHMGYSRAERDEYWRQTKQILQEIPQNDLLIWAADNNGKIARTDQETRDGDTIPKNAHIGQWHYAQETKRGNGQELVNMMNKFCLAATNRIHPPKNKQKEKLITWTSGDGKIHMRPDYIIISNNVQNWLKITKTKGAENTNTINQHIILYMEIRVKFKEKKGGGTYKTR